MAKLRITREQYLTLVDTFREDPTNYASAGRAAGIGWRTAKRAYHEGWPGVPWAKPIREVLQEELIAARARAEIAEEQAALEVEREEHHDSLAVERARQNAIKSKEQEGQLVASARASALLGLVAAVKAAPGLSPLLDRLGQELKELSAIEKWSDKDRGTALVMMRRYAMTVRELAAAGQTAMEMERLLLGEPTSIVGVQTQYDQMPLDELVKAAGYMDDQLKRAEHRGLVVLKGGLGEEAPKAKGSA